MPGCFSHPCHVWRKASPQRSLALEGTLGMRCSLRASASLGIRFQPLSRQSCDSSAPSAAHLASARLAVCCALPTSPDSRTCFAETAFTVAAHAVATWAIKTKPRIADVS